MLSRASVGLRRHPVWQCGFRPFFLVTAASAAVLVPAWLAMLAGLLPMPVFPGGPVAWHVHELVMGFGLASVLGFSLTAVPEFTGTPAFRRRLTIGLFSLWLLSRLLVLLLPWTGPWPLAVAQSALCLGLLAAIAPPIWHDPTRRHRELGWGFVALLLAAAAVSLDLALGGRLLGTPIDGLRLVLHLMLLLIVLTLARISMRVVNRHLAEAGAEPDYLARPPRRQIAALLMLLHALAVLVGLQGAAGWLALGAGLACLGLLSDWPHTRVLLRRWVALLYALPWLLGAGYLLDGAARLGAPLPPSAGEHLLAVGALGLAVFAVLCIAGRTHAGLGLDERRWLPFAAGLLVGAAILRTLAGLAGFPTLPLWWVAGLLWTAAFGLWLLRIGPDLARRRNDGGWGCAGPMNKD
jgi:uncharacterized protein involved in response to NO